MVSRHSAPGGETPIARVQTAPSAAQLAARIAWPTSPGAFRLMLALLVFVHHFTSFGFGKYAVYVFFVLSGFWVDRMWMARYRTTHQPVLTYAVSRAWRLLPTFVLVGAIAIAAELLIGVPLDEMTGGNPARLAFSSLFIVGYTQLDYLPISPGWSLDIEVQYYALVPMLSLVVRHMGVRLTLAILTAITVASALMATSVILTSYLFFFAVGMSASVVDWRPSGRVAAWSAGLLIAGLAAITLGPLHGVLFGGAHPSPLYIWNPLLNIAAAIVTIPLAIYTTRQKSDESDRMMADLSYVVYLAHWPEIVWISSIGGSALHRLPYAAGGFVFVILLSWVIWRFFDRPINGARARWVAARIDARPSAIAREVPAL